MGVTVICLEWVLPNLTITIGERLITANGIIISQNERFLKISWSRGCVIPIFFGKQSDSVLTLWTDTFLKKNVSDTILVNFHVQNP